MIKTQFHTTIQKFNTDNGTEFVNRSVYQLFSEHGILHQRSCPHTPQQTGVVERRHRSLLNTARALMFTSGLSMRFWPYSLLTATWLVNRVPSKVLDWSCPYEMLFKKEPNYGLLRPFGCLAFAVDLSPSRGKFESRSIKCIFLGYDVHHKGFTLYDLDTHRIFVSRDVKFFPNKFPYVHEYSSSIPSLPPNQLDFISISSDENHVVPSSGNEDLIPSSGNEETIPPLSSDSESFIDDLHSDPIDAKVESPIGDSGPPSTVTPPVVQRGRIRKPPIWMQDYV